MIDHQPLLSEIGRELLWGDPVFPTSMQLAVSIRETLERPSSTLAEIARLVALEPLTAAKVHRLANCVTFNPYGQTVYGVDQTVARVGVNVVRSVAISIAITQLKSAPAMAPYLKFADHAWERSICVAVLARLLAKASPVIPDEAMLCGLVSDLGVFYLLYRASTWPEYAANHQAMQDLLRTHRIEVGTQLLRVLGMPGNIVNANSRATLDSAHPAHSLRAVVTEACRLARLPDPIPADDPRAEWLQTVRDQVSELRHALLA